MPDLAQHKTNLDMAAQLGRIEIMTAANAAQLTRLEIRLLGEDGDTEGGFIGDLRKRVRTLEDERIRVNAKQAVICTVAVTMFHLLTGPRLEAALAALLGGKP